MQDSFFSVIHFVVKIVFFFLSFFDYASIITLLKKNLTLGFLLMKFGFQPIYLKLGILNKKEYFCILNLKKMNYMKSTVCTFILLTMVVIGFAQKGKKSDENPFFTEWKTPYGIPPFEKIKNEHFIPAFELGMKQQKEAIQDVVNSSEQATFKNTIEAIENSGKLLSRVSSVFSNLRSANTSAELQKIATAILPKLSAHSDDINLNPLLFKRIEVVYKNRNSENLNVEQIRLVENYHKNFIRSGVKLDASKQERLRAINQEMSSLTLKFGDNLLTENNSFILVVSKQEDLKGLPESVIQAAREEANSRKLTDKWVFTLNKPSLIPFLQYSENRSLREFLYKGYLNRANNGNEFDNNDIISKIVNLRLERAKLLGYENHATFVLEDNMAKTPQRVFDLFDKIWNPALNRAMEEENDMYQLSKEENSGIEKIESWDWWYYAEKVRKNKYNLDEEELRPFFKLENVRDGIFWVCNQLYGIRFTEIKKDIPKYHPEVTVYQVDDNDGKLLGVLMMDFFPRSSKRGGAWCTSYQPAHYIQGKRITPVVSVVCNFTKPTADKPSLLNQDEVETFFHEFGHALHGLFSNCQYKGSIGVSRDFVELPSQIMEHWATQPVVLKQYAKHYKTNEIITDALIEKMQKSGKFNQGFATVEFLSAAYLDMMYHTKPLDKPFNPSSFEKEMMTQRGLISSIAPRYRSTYFQHIFSGGYSAGYYSYIWAEVLDSDAYNAFVETGDIFNKKVANDFRTKILERGNTVNPLQMYLDFRGKEPDIYPLLKNRGLAQ